MKLSYAYVLFLTSLGFIRAQKLFFQVGGQLDLKPRAPSSNYTYLSWKQGTSLVAEWFEGTKDIKSYGLFKTRTTLNKDTGHLTIKDLNRNDSGTYSLESNVEKKQFFDISVIRPAPKPVISLTPLECSSKEESCSLSCDADITDVGPVTYLWKMDAGEWFLGERMKKVDRLFTQEWVSCKLNNSLGESEPSANPFINKAAAAQKFFQVGGQLDLKPRAPLSPFSYLSWKQGTGLVAEWFKGTKDIKTYGLFKTRTTLNKDTGQLTIKDLNPNDSGTYSLESNVEKKQFFDISVIRPAPKPVISLKPLKCSSKEESCYLSCDADITDVGPVTYLWKMDAGEWFLGERMKKIDRLFTHEWVSCKLNNSLGESEPSEPIANPFINKVLSGGAIAGIIFFIIFIIIILVSLYLSYKNKHFIPWLNKERFIPWLNTVFSRHQPVDTEDPDKVHHGGEPLGPVGGGE